MVTIVAGIFGAGEVFDHDLPAAEAGARATFAPVPTAAGPAHSLAIATTGFRLAAPIQRVVAVSSGNVVYLAGGLDAAGVTVDGVFALDPVSGRLRLLGHLPLAVHDAAGAFIRGKLFIFAGGNGSGTDTVQEFDPATGHGAVVAHLPVALSDLASATVGATTYLIGGYDGIRPRREIYATTDGKQFRIAAQLPLGLRYPAVAVADGKIVIAGGLSAKGLSAAAFVYDPDSGRIARIGQLPTAVAHSAAFALGGTVYIAGGRNASDVPIGAVTSIDPTTRAIKSEPKLPGALADAGVASVAGGALLIGGDDGRTLDQILRATLRAPEPTPHPSTGAASSANPSNVYAGIDTQKLSPAVANDKHYLYVPNGILGTVEVIDPSTYHIVRTIRFGLASYPEHVSPSWDMRWLYVDVDGRSELGVIDPRTGKLVRIIHGVDHPYNLYFTPDGTKAIDVAEYENALRFMNPHTWKLIKSVPLPCHGPDHMDFSRDGSYLMISCEYDGTVVRVSLSSLKVVGTVHVGGLPVDVKLSPDGSLFYVANQGLGGVSLIDPSRMKVVKFIPTGRGAHGMAISRDTRDLYLTNRLAGTISVIDFASRRVVHTWKVVDRPTCCR